ncbi:hypothetical protein CO038_01360 [Candidatus Pacearchaeota archaeon CG_4_9_14_0_2_um_filter_39_13]|nr:hypothetical protein [Candidatus Pacearchaeota archaeon]PJC44937.1 MAG: hypothetical protein CO038_01360 [Candidatus Pacearchaeota archaeon CG_4_9_14_0_2_um_filter_39_13]
MASRQRVFQLYERRKVGEENKMAYQLERLPVDQGGERIFHHGWNAPLSISGFARLAASEGRRLGEIRGSDRLITLSSPVFVPGNHYIDVPVSPDDLIEFWQAYHAEYPAGRNKPVGMGGAPGIPGVPVVV